MSIGDRGSSISDGGSGSLNMDVGLSSLLSVDVGLSLDFLMNIGLSSDLNLSLYGLLMDIRFGLNLLMDIGLSLNFLVEVRFSLDLLVYVTLSNGVGLRVGDRGIESVGIESSDRGKLSSNGLSSIGVSRGGSSVSVSGGVGVCSTVVGSTVVSCGENSSRS